MMKKQKTKTNNDEEEVLKYTPLVKSFAKSFSKTNKTVCYDDLFQEGFIGLLIARNKWKPSFNTTLGAYAVPYIFGAIYRYVNNSKNIKNTKLMKNNINFSNFNDNKNNDFVSDIYDFIESYYVEKDVLILKMTISNYRKREIIKKLGINSDYYDNILEDFSNNLKKNYH